jgi:serine/threonine-protein kinase
MAGAVKSDRWEAVVALFDQALALPGDERDRFLAGATSDVEVRERVLAMLRADETPHSLLDAAPDRLLHLLASGTRDREGERIGPYVLGREIGRGGAATVYLATDEKHRRSVALKLLHAGASTCRLGSTTRTGAASCIAT